MAASDDQVAALRAFLAFEPDEGVRRTRRLVEANRVEGISELVYAALVTAVRRRFHPVWTIPDVISFVAIARARFRGDEIRVDPRVAETLLRRVLGEDVAAEPDEEANARAQIFLLCALIGDAELSDAELDEFLVQARALAGRLVA